GIPEPQQCVADGTGDHCPQQEPGRGLAVARPEPRIVHAYAVPGGLARRTGVGRPDPLPVAHTEVDDGAGDPGGTDGGTVAEIPVPDGHRGRRQIRERLMPAQPRAYAEPPGRDLAAGWGVPLAADLAGDGREGAEGHHAGTEPGSQWIVVVGPVQPHQ